MLVRVFFKARKFQQGEEWVSHRGVIMAVPGKLVRSSASLRALAALKQGILKSIDVDKPSAAHVEGISPQDFIFSLGCCSLLMS